ncbi:MAG: MoaD/ThiS family protein [Anaerolineae bacterium]|nr:MoaD/ThiS family protein [Anaerolineae bacterium]MDW8101610.1 MoaD/ThiS family protein [Anaerolineae bacterium]
MKVTTRVYATLKRYIPEGKSDHDMEVDLPAGTTVGELIENFLKIPPDAVKVVFVNGRHAEMNQVLNEGDRVGIFPPVAGG